MEVHHHPQVERKRFKEYFLEFLMIFLAVTMGFFAESLREGISNREREKQYVELLVQDLKKDTAALDYSIRRLNVDIQNADTLLSLYAHDQLKGEDDDRILILSITCGLSVDIIFNDRAASQLKNSGSMGLIRKKDVAATLLQYWNNQIRLNQIHDRFESIRMEHHRLSYKTFHWYKWYYQNAEGTDSVLLRSHVKAFINFQNVEEFVNIVSNLYNMGKVQYLPYLRSQLQLATQLIELINKEYNPG
jgi:hypothetical protein